MKTEFEKMTEWIDHQIYFHTIAKNAAPTANDRLAVAEKLQVFLEIKQQMLIFKTECDNEFLNVNFGKRKMIDELADARYTKQPHISTGLPYTNLNK